MLMQKYIEPEDDQLIPLSESMEKMNKFMYACIISDVAIEAEEQEFDLDIDIVEACLS